MRGHEGWKWEQSGPTGTKPQITTKGGLRPTEKCTAQMKTTCPLEYKAGNLPINYKWLITWKKFRFVIK